MGSLRRDTVYYCTGLTSVTIPDGVTSIGESAFSHCSGLASVTIGNGVRSIGDYVFGDCSGLTNISVAAGNPQYSSANGLLLNKDGTTVLAGVNGDVAISDGVTSIWGSAFSGRTGLTSVTIPDSVTSIGAEAFSGCSSLAVLYVPTGWDARTILSDTEVPSGCAIVAYDATGETKTTEAPVAVPQAWLAKKAGWILAGTEGCCDYEAAAWTKASNEMAVWECYLIGLDPASEDAAFTVKLDFVDG